MRVCKQFKIDAAHSLPGYNGKCAMVHGHTWRITIGVEGLIFLATGMVIDLNYLTTLFKPIEAQLDHTVINNTILNPTAENLVEFIAGKIIKDLLDNPHLKNVYIRVQEGDGGWAEDTIPISEGRIK